MKDILRLVRKNVIQMKPYSSARDLWSGGILLDANENPFPPVQALNGINGLNRYPDPKQTALRKAVSEKLGVRPEKLFFGVGSDEIIDLLIRIFCYPGKDEIIINEPTYGMYRVAADFNDVTVKNVMPDDDFQPDADAVIKAAGINTKLIFLCSPNNPTGNLLAKDRVEQIISSTDAIVVIDEAYIDFTPRDTFLPLLEKYNNLVIMRTFSKAMGLAGIRLGYCAADQEIINLLFKVKAPYNINTLTSQAALEAMSDSGFFESAVSTITSERNSLSEFLRSLPVIEKVYPSDANYILIRSRISKEIFSALIDAGIVIRDRSNQPKLENCLRITVGSPEENQKLKEVLKKL